MRSEDERCIKQAVIIDEGWLGGDATNCMDESHVMVCFPTPKRCGKGEVHWKHTALLEQRLSFLIKHYFSLQHVFHSGADMAPSANDASQSASIFQLRQKQVASTRRNWGQDSRCLSAQTWQRALAAEMIFATRRTVESLNYACMCGSTCPLLCQVARRVPHEPQRCCTSLRVFIMYGIKQSSPVKQHVMPAHTLPPSAPDAPLLMGGTVLTGWYCLRDS